MLDLRKPTPFFVLPSSILRVGTLRGCSILSVLALYRKHYTNSSKKRRRVKCDEAKPKCNRCLNVGVECDGYPKFHQDMRPRPLLPLQIPGNLSVAPFSGIQCQNEFEFKHFQHFQNEIALDLSGALDKLNWNRIIISGCRLEPHVLTAVVAISALSVSRKLNREAKDEASRANAIRYRQLALKHHEKSLQVMRETLGKRPDVRSALGACLMVCFFGKSISRINTSCFGWFNAVYFRVVSWE